MPKLNKSELNSEIKSRRFKSANSEVLSNNDVRIELILGEEIMRDHPKYVTEERFNQFVNVVNRIETRLDELTAIVIQGFKQVNDRLDEHDKLFKEHGWIK